MSHNTTQASNTQRSRQPLLRETVTVVAVPSVAIENDRLVVGPSHSSTAHSVLPLPSVLTFNSLYALVYSYQSSRRWLLWHCLAMRLAHHPSTQHSLVPHAVWQRRTPRVGGQAARCRETDEETMGGRLGRMFKAERTGGASLLTFFSAEQSNNITISSHCAQFHFTRISFPCTTFFFSQPPKNSILSSSLWRGTSIISSNRGKAQEHWLVVLYLQYSDKSALDLTIYTHGATFTET